MSFEQQFERPPVSSQEKAGEQAEQKEVRKEGLEGLRDYIKEMSLELKEEGVPVDDKARIDISKFDKVYSRQSIESDRAWIKDLKGRWERSAAAESRWSWAYPKEKALKDVPVGDVFEMLTTSILHKKLSKDFIVARTSEYDDARNKVDNIILERETGNIICAFDEIGASSGERFDEKRNKVLERNWQRGGADLKYGLSLEKKADGTELRKGAVYQIPLFYLSLPEEEIKKALHDPALEESIFRSFVNSVSEQTKIIKEGPVHPKLRKRLDFFEKIIEKF
jgi:hypothetical protein